MNHLLAAEWLKLQKRWMPRVLVLIMVALIALIFWGIGTSNSRINDVMPRGWLVALFLASGIAPFLWPILGGSWAGNEYGWGTIRMILSRRPDRIQWALAAIIALLISIVFALIAALIVGTLAGIAVALLTNHPIFVTSGLQSNYLLVVVKMFVATWYVLAFYVILAYAAGTIFRSGAVGIGTGIGAIVAQVVVFGIFQGLGGTWKNVAEHFPNAYANSLINRVVSEGTTSDFGSSFANTPGIEQCVVGLAIYIAVLLGITLFLVHTRDVTS